MHIELTSGEKVPALGQGIWCLGEDQQSRANELLAPRLDLDLTLSRIWRSSIEHSRRRRASSRSR